MIIRLNEINIKRQLKPDKVIAGPVWFPPIPGKAPMTSNTKENNENVIINETKFNTKDINNKIKANILQSFL